MERNNEGLDVYGIPERRAMEKQFYCKQKSIIGDLR
jgi:hypothetical protein